MFMRKIATPLLCASALCTSPALAAGDAGESREYLPEIIVTGVANGYVSADGSSGTKTDTPIINVPQSIQVITSDQVQDQAISSLNGALRFVPGVTLDAGEGHRDQAIIRGQKSTADFYLDGLRDDAEYYRALYNIERIEVLKGANALIFGRGGAGGVINRVSKTPNLGSSKSRLSGEIGQYGQYSLSADSDHTISDTIGMRVNGTYEAHRNHRDGFAGHFVGIAPSLRMVTAGGTALNLSYNYDNDIRTTDRGVPSLNGRPIAGYDKVLFGDKDFNRSEIQVHHARGTVAREFSDHLSANATVQYGRYDKVYANILPRSANGVSAEFSGYRSAATRDNFIAQANVVWKTNTFGIAHHILAGVEYTSQHSRANRQDAYFAKATGGTAARITLPLAPSFAFPAISLGADNRNVSSNLNVTSLYIQDQIALGDHVDVLGGVRWDRFDLNVHDFLTSRDTFRVDEMVSPRLGVVLKPGANLSFYGSYGVSFLPQSGDQFTLLSQADAALEPEEFENWEIGTKYQATPNTLLTAAIFQIDRSNSKAADAQNSGLYTLTGASRTKGIEINLSGRIMPKLSSNIGYAYMEGEITSATTNGPAGARMAQLPRHHITAWNYYEVTKSASIGLGVIHQSHQLTSYSNRVTLPGFWRIDFAAFYELGPHLKMQLNAENIANTHYYPSNYGDDNITPGAPFNVKFGLKFEF